MGRIFKLIALCAGSLALATTFAAPSDAIGLNITTQICLTGTYNITPGPGAGQKTILVNASGCTVLTQPGTYSATLSAVVNSIGSIGCTAGLGTGTGVLSSSFHGFATSGFVLVAGETIVFESNLGAIGAESVLSVGQVLLPNPLPCGPGGTGPLVFTIPTPPLAVAVS